MWSRKVYPLVHGPDNVQFLKVTILEEWCGYSGRYSYYELDKCYIKDRNYKNDSRSGLLRDIIYRGDCGYWYIGHIHDKMEQFGVIRSDHANYKLPTECLNWLIQERNGGWKNSGKITIDID